MVFSKEMNAFIDTALAQLGAQPDATDNRDAPDMVNHPPHYTSHPARCECGAGIECIQITEHMNFCIGNAVKYLWRADLKGGMQDLEKARWYIDREIARRTMLEGKS